MADIKDSLIFAVKLDKDKISDFVNEIIEKMTETIKAIDVESIDLFKAGYEKGKDVGCKEFAKRFEYHMKYESYPPDETITMLDIKAGIDTVLSEMEKEWN